MSQSLADIILHIVFSTKERRPLIQADIEEELYQYISGIGRNLKSPIIAINGVADHIHILLQQSGTIAPSKLVSDLKSNSSRWIKTKGDHYKDFSWQNGYGLFSVSRPNIDGAIRYIAKQKEHHNTVSFQNEFLMMLQRAKLKYDEKYLWD